jgi:hypothetical protein
MRESRNIAPPPDPQGLNPFRGTTLSTNHVNELSIHGLQVWLPVTSEQHLTLTPKATQW